jgi:hypothetical protein
LLLPLHLSVGFVAKGFVLRAPRLVERFVGHAAGDHVAIPDGSGQRGQRFDRGREQFRGRRGLGQAAVQILRELIESKRG